MNNERHDKKWESVIFVYNADSDLFSTVSDFAHKIISPSTYSCQLCALTYGNFAMKKEWKDFLGELKLNKVFMHKDEFRKKYPHESRTSLPAVFGIREGSLQTVIGADEFRGIGDLKALKQLVGQRLGHG